MRVVEDGFAGTGPNCVCRAGRVVRRSGAAQVDAKRWGARALIRTAPYHRVSERDKDYFPEAFELTVDRP
jgi:hypothetical protein